MKLSTNILLFITINLFFVNSSSAQTCSALNITHQADIATTCPLMTVTMKQDNLGRNFLYVANKEAGLKIYNISSLSSPVLVKTIPTDSLDSLDVMNVSQNGNFLYLALGNTFTSPERSGMAIIDVTTPASAFVTDMYEHAGPVNGSGIVVAEGNYAYLGAMGNGLIILDITDKFNIVFKSQFIPDINYPTTIPNPALYNARGMEVKNDIVYLCYDAGGLRIINTVNKLLPVETGHYSNPVMNGLPRAYNNIVLVDSLAYIAVDYCGMEVLNVADTSNITLFGWWNPYNCPTNNWFSSPVHANEIAYDSQCNLIFLSTGKSDMFVVNVANPALPDSCNFYGGVANNIGTWGLSLYQNNIYLSYICAIIPFSSLWTGVKILTYTPCTTGIANAPEGDEIKVYPIPSSNEINIEMENAFVDMKKVNLSVTDVLGKTINVSSFSVKKKIILDISSLSEGIYFIHLSDEEKFYSRKFVKEN